MTELIQKFLTHFTYVALVLILLAAGMGVPIPEDVPLIFSGYLCHPSDSPLVDANGDGMPDTQSPKVPKLPLMMLAGMIGVLGGDTFVFFVGRRGIDSNNFVARHIRKVLHSKRREKVERHFRMHGNLTVFAGRFMPGARSLVFAMAGMSRMSYPRFLIIDGLAAAISVPAFILLGHHFATNISHLMDGLKHAKEMVAPFLIAAAAIVAAIYLLRRRRLKPAPAPAASAAPSRPTPPMVSQKR